MTFQELIQKHSLTPICDSYIGDGWVPLVDDLLTKLKATGWEGEVEQVKEKFGALRVYVSNASDEHCSLIWEVEEDSLKVCERCGYKDNVTTAGEFWLKTLCPTCREQRDKE